MLLTRDMCDDVDECDDRDDVDGCDDRDDVDECDDCEAYVLCPKYFYIGRFIYVLQTLFCSGLRGEDYGQ